MKLDNIKIREDLSDIEVVKKACNKNMIDFSSVKQYRIIKKSIDARRKSQILYIYSVLPQMHSRKHISSVA